MIMIGSEFAYIYFCSRMWREIGISFFVICNFYSIRRSYVVQPFFG